MNMKKTITLAALTLSTGSFALQMPPLATKTACLQTYEYADGSVALSDCDASENNKSDKKVILENGCAEGQSALTQVKYKKKAEFQPVIYSCMPSNVVQL